MVWKTPVTLTAKLCAQSSGAKGASSRPLFFLIFCCIFLLLLLLPLQPALRCGIELFVILRLGCSALFPVPLYQSENDNSHSGKENDCVGN